jgi:hypothetical protein
MNTSDYLRYLVKRELANLGYLSKDVQKTFGIRVVEAEAP